MADRHPAGPQERRHRREHGGRQHGAAGDHRSDLIHRHAARGSPVHGPDPGHSRHLTGGARPARRGGQPCRPQHAHRHRPAAAFQPPSEEPAEIPAHRCDGTDRHRPRHDHPIPPPDGLPRRPPTPPRHRDLPEPPGNGGQRITAAGGTAPPAARCGLLSYPHHPQALSQTARKDQTYAARRSHPSQHQIPKVRGVGAPTRPAWTFHRSENASNRRRRLPRWRLYSSCPRRY